MISTRLFFLFALVMIGVHAQDYEGEQFDPSAAGQGGQPGLDQFGVQPDFSPEGGEQQFDGEQFDGGFIGQPQGGQQFEGGMQPNFAEESQRVSRILPALRN